MSDAARDRLIVAYSGSAAGSSALAALVAARQAEIVTVTIDVGQGRVLESIRDKALTLGAARAHVIDRRDAFVQAVVLPALKAGVPLATQLRPGLLVRPLVARTLVEVATVERASTVAHTDTERRSTLDTLIKALRPRWKIVTPAREGDATDPRAPRVDVTLWARTLSPVPGDLRADTFVLTREPLAGPATPARVAISLERGVPTLLNDVSMPVTELVATLTTVAGAHGVGRVVLDAEVPVVAEAPAAVLLHAAHQELARATMSRDFERFSSQVSAAYADLLANGQWHSPFRQALDGYVDVAQQRLTGTVVFELHRGTVSIVDRRLASSRRESILPLAHLS